MKTAGFEEIRVDEVPIVLSAPSSTFMDFFQKFGVRLTMILDRQDAAVNQTIEDEIVAGFARFDEGGTLQLPMPAIVVSGRKSGG